MKTLLGGRHLVVQLLVTIQCTVGLADILIPERTLRKHGDFIREVWISGSIDAGTLDTMLDQLKGCSDSVATKLTKDWIRLHATGRWSGRPARPIVFVNRTDHQLRFTIVARYDENGRQHTDDGSWVIRPEESAGATDTSGNVLKACLLAYGVSTVDGHAVQFAGVIPAGASEDAEVRIVLTDEHIPNSVPKPNAYYERRRGSVYKVGDGVILIRSERNAETPTLKRDEVLGVYRPSEGNRLVCEATIIEVIRGSPFPKARFSSHGAPEVGDYLASIRDRSQLSGLAATGTQRAGATARTMNSSSGVRLPADADTLTEVKTRRIWTNALGTKLEATLEGRPTDIVQLRYRSSNGKECLERLPLSRISAPDLDLLVRAFPHLKSSAESLHAQRREWLAQRERNVRENQTTEREAGRAFFGALASGYQGQLPLGGSITAAPSQNYVPNSQGRNQGTALLSGMTREEAKAKLSKLRTWTDALGNSQRATIVDWPTKEKQQIRITWRVGRRTMGLPLPLHQLSEEDVRLLARTFPLVEEELPSINAQRESWVKAKIEADRADRVAASKITGFLLGALAKGAERALEEEGFGTGSSSPSPSDASAVSPRQERGSSSTTDAGGGQGSKGSTPSRVSFTATIYVRDGGKDALWFNKTVYIEKYDGFVPPVLDSYTSSGWYRLKSYRTDDVGRVRVSFSDPHAYFRIHDGNRRVHGFRASQAASLNGRKVILR